MEYQNSKHSNALPGYLKISTLKPGAFFHADLKSSLENIVFKDKLGNEKGILGRIISDKTKTLKATIKALAYEIKLRETLDSHVLNNIDDDVSNQNTLLKNLKNIKIGYSQELSREINDKKLQIENNCLELEKEKRKEYLECWKDLMFLKKYLHSALKDYWDLAKRRNLLSSDLSN
tara:strand:- start:549 stop:1076 length:528 start_codon:yes stop_codon:yes gene_type:complete